MEQIDQAIGVLQAKLRRHEDAARNTKRVINELLGEDGRDPLYEIDETASTGVFKIARDQFHRKVLTTAMREFLEIRRAAPGMDGLSTIAEIYEALKDGGYQFEAKTEDYAKRGIRSSLTRNTAIFYRMPDKKHFGLAKWYGVKPGRKADGAEAAGENGNGSNGDAEAVDETAEEGGDDA